MRCWLFGHKYKREGKYSNNNPRYVCGWCDKTWAGVIIGGDNIQIRVAEREVKFETDETGQNLEGREQNARRQSRREAEKKACEGVPTEALKNIRVVDLLEGQETK